MTTADWTAYARRLADLLAERGDILTSQWFEAVAQVPRHTFVHEVFEQDRTGQWISWETEGRWDTVYSPATLVTALANSRGFPEPASSSTNPELMVRMLEMLAIEDAHRVLEIGTGTGYNAALLAHRVGGDRVFSVDIDPDLVAQAEQRLHAIGYRPTLAATDGHDGLPTHAPYDRIIATCSVPAVPQSWITQLASGGSILVDLKLAISAGNLVHLHRDDNGGARGRFSTRWASFMAIRGHVDHDSHDRDGTRPAARDRQRDEPADRTDDERSRSTHVPVPPWSTPVLWFLAQLTGLPRGTEFGVLLDPDTATPTTASLTGPDGSRARVGLAPDTEAGDYIVIEAGDISLWEPIERAHQLWIDAGRPGWERFGLSVDSDGRNTVWLDDPTGEHTWQL